MNSSAHLSLEQQFNLRTFSDQVQRMSREQAQEFLIRLQEQMMLRENMYQAFLRKDWGLDSDAMSI